MLLNKDICIQPGQFFVEKMGQRKEGSGWIWKDEQEFKAKDILDKKKSKYKFKPL